MTTGNSSDVLNVSGGTPKLITTFTSGTGTYVPTADMARCLVRIQAAGAGGAAANYGGGGGAMIEIWLRVPIAGLAYVVGAAGAAGANGSKSSFGNFVALPGGWGNSSEAGYGGPTSLSNGTAAGSAVTLFESSGGIAGGSGGGSGTSGQIAGFPVSTSASGFAAVPSAANNVSAANVSNGQGNGSGGNSFYGKGGTTGNAPAAGNYGAGGGVNAAGLGGCVEIFEYGV